MVCENNTTVLLEENALLFVPSYECNSQVSPSDFDHLGSGYRLTYSDRLDGGPLLHPRTMGGGGGGGHAGEKAVGVIDARTCVWRGDRFDFCTFLILKIV